MADVFGNSQVDIILVSSIRHSVIKTACWDISILYMIHTCWLLTIRYSRLRILGY